MKFTQCAYNVCNVYMIHILCNKEIHKEGARPSTSRPLLWISLSYIMHILWYQTCIICFVYLMISFIGGWGRECSSTSPAPGNRFVSFVRACARCILCRLGGKMSCWPSVSFIFWSGGFIFYLRKAHWEVSKESSQWKFKDSSRRRAFKREFSK